jgi:hypothetical protein
MVCHANNPFINIRRTHPKWAVITVHENFHQGTISPGNRTTHNYPNQVYHLMIEQRLFLINKRKAQVNNCIIA